MIAELMPDKVTEVWEVKRRTGKIRIDYTQNVINKTLAGPYSGPAGCARAGVGTDRLGRAGRSEVET